MSAFEQAEPGDTDPPGTLPMNCPPFPSWDTLPAAEYGVEPRSLYATLVLAGAMSGTGLSGLAHHCRPKACGEPTALLREAVRAAFVVADEVLRQAWDGPPAGSAAGVAS